MSDPLDFTLTHVRTKEITKRARQVVNLENKCARLRKQLDEAQDELITARRFLRGVVADAATPTPPPAEHDPLFPGIEP